MALDWAYSNGETVFAGGGMKAVDGMNAWTKAIREALEQPEQEPVAWMDSDGDVLSASIVDGTGLRNIPLYTTPPQRKPLTDAQERQNFEQWYAENAFDYASNPIGSRECGLQWNAWRARAYNIKERNT